MVLTFHQHTPGALSPCHASEAPQGKSNCDIGMSRLKEEGAVAAPAGSNSGFSSADNAYSVRCKKGVPFRKSLVKIQRWARPFRKNSAFTRKDLDTLMSRINSAQAKRAA